MSFNTRESLKDVLGNYRIQDWRYAAFYIGVPLALAIYSALNNQQLLEFAGYLDTFGFYLAQSFLPYWFTAICTILVMIVLRPWKPPPIVIMLLGVLVSCFIAAPYTEWVGLMYQQRWQGLPVPRQAPVVYSFDFWVYVLRASVWWVVINVVFDRYVGLPRYRYLIPKGFDVRAPSGTNAVPDKGDAEKTQQILPGFLERLPELVRLEDILAIKAEQHYIGIMTPERNYMVLYRFRDAVRELSADLGLQVHRSYWVSKKGIDCLHSGGKKFGVCLKNSEFIPVSVPYQGVVKQLARELGVPSRPLPAGS